MNINSMLTESLIIMILGMIVVFFFLSLMIFIVNIFNRILNKNDRQQKVMDDSSQAKLSKLEEKQLNLSANIDEEIVSAIYIAIQKYEEEKILN